VSRLHIIFTEMNTFPFNLPSAKTVSAKDTNTSTGNIFSPERFCAKETEQFVCSVEEENGSSIPNCSVKTQNRQDKPSRGPQVPKESQTKLLVKDIHSISPYFSDEPKINGIESDDKLICSDTGNEEEPESARNDGDEGSEGIQRKPREFRKCDAQFLEKEFECLVTQLNDKRKHDMENFQKFSESLRTKTEEIISNLEKTFKMRYELTDEKLDIVGNELFAQLEKGIKMEKSLNDLKLRVAGILQQLETFTGESLPPSPKKSRNA